MMDEAKRGMRGQMGRTFRSKEIGLALVLLLAACGSGTAARENAVAAQMRDPASVQFRDVRAGRQTLCGEINAKNGFGGYVGFRRFIATFAPGDGPSMDFGPADPVSQSDYQDLIKIDAMACEGAKVELPKMGIAGEPDQCSWAKRDKERRDDSRHFEQSFASCR